MANKCGNCKDYHKIGYEYKGKCWNSDFRNNIITTARLEDENGEVRHIIIPTTLVNFTVREDFCCKYFNKDKPSTQTKI